MRKILVSAAVALFATTQAFAIAGIGAHFVMNTGSLKADKGEVLPIPNLGAITLEQQKADGLKGLGFKAWVDIIPFVDVELTANIVGARYATVLQVPTLNENGEIVNKDFPMEVDLGLPFFGKATPLFSASNFDLSVTYPFDFLPIIRPYIGGGFSYIITTPIMNKKFVSKFLEREDVQGAFLGDPADIDADKIGTALAKALEDERFTFGAGAHAIAGIRIKPPIIPIAIYANGKYYFGGNVDSQFSNGFVLEVGGGFAL
ncbi:hypothetical protein AGMMS49938_02930 [Fibrobacterales bacterium]|nr:hypothetical protein AGMMS49938_02930 [Fibrobacterales bacterium]